MSRWAGSRDCSQRSPEVEESLAVLPVPRFASRPIPQRRRPVAGDPVKKVGMTADFPPISLDSLFVLSCGLELIKPELFAYYFHKDAIGQFAFQEVDNAALHIALEDLARGLR